MLALAYLGKFPQFEIGYFSPSGARIDPPRRVNEALMTLEAHAVEIPPTNSDLILASRKIDRDGVVRWLGIYTHAVEPVLGRPGVYCGVGVWLENSYLDTTLALPEIRSLLADFSRSMTENLHPSLSERRFTMNSVDIDRAALQRIAGSIREDGDPYKSVGSKKCCIFSSTGSTGLKIDELINHVQRSQLLLQYQKIFLTENSDIYGSFRRKGYVDFISDEQLDRILNTTSSYVQNAVVIEPDRPPMIQYNASSEGGVGVADARRNTQDGQVEPSVMTADSRYEDLRARVNRLVSQATRAADHFEQLDAAIAAVSIKLLLVFFITIALCSISIGLSLYISMIRSPVDTANIARPEAHQKPDTGLTSPVPNGSDSGQPSPQASNGAAAAGSTGSGNSITPQGNAGKVEGPLPTPPQSPCDNINAAINQYRSIRSEAEQVSSNKGLQLVKDLDKLQGYLEAIKSTCNK